MIDWPDKLVHDVARRRAVAFLGAGVSRRSMTPEGHRPPLWREFLENALKKCGGPQLEINRLLKSNDYLTACQLIKYRLGNNAWHDFLEESFLNPNYCPDQIHQSIFDLDLPAIIYFT